MSNSTLLPAYTNPDVKNYLIQNGASGTIYAFAFPESRAIVQEVLDGGEWKKIINDAILSAVEEFNQSALGSNDLVSFISSRVEESFSKQRGEYTDIFEGAWTSRQDAIDEHFFTAWKKWCSPVVTLAQGHSNFMYPTAGASEGLRQSINDYGQLARINFFEPVIHVFEGEYEGFKSYAEAAHITVVMHKRSEWKDCVDKIGPHDQFYISQPSAIDGNVWNEFDKFADALNAAQPSAELMLDLTYVGSVAKDFHINADHPNIPTIFFSLSKPFGVYYHRIGGVMTREEMPSLKGNKWFKIAQSIQVGTALLERSSVQELPRKYEAIRDDAIRNVNERLALSLVPSDVLLFATAPEEEVTGDILPMLLRGPADGKFMRVCITPEMARLTPDGVFMDMATPPIQPPSAVSGPSLGEMKP